MFVERKIVSNFQDEQGDGGGGPHTHTHTLTHSQTNTHTPTHPHTHTHTHTFIYIPPTLGWYYKWVISKSDKWTYMGLFHRYIYDTL